MAVRAKFDLLLLLFVVVADDDEEDEGMGVGGADEDGEINGAAGAVDSLGSSLSDR